MSNPAKYVHTNLIAKDWRALAAFYQELFGCIPVPPERDFRGADLEAATGLPDAHLTGMHLRLAFSVAAHLEPDILLVDEGQINPHVTDENRQEWGYTVKNLDTTWRSGLGISQDGRFLIYAAGNSLTVQTLANALQQGGAYYAMQLDINSFYTRFVTYQAAPDPKASGYPLVANKLLNQMSGDPALFLHPYNRDFFYITYRQ